MSLLPEKKVSCGGYLHFVFPIGEGLKSRGSDDSIHPFWFDISSIHEQRVAGKKKLYAALFEAKGGAHQGKPVLLQCRQVLHVVDPLLADCRCTVRHSCGETARKRVFLPVLEQKNLAKINLGRWFLLSEE